MEEEHVIALSQLPNIHHVCMVNKHWPAGGIQVFGGGADASGEPPNGTNLPLAFLSHHQYHWRTVALLQRRLQAGTGPPDECQAAAGHQQGTPNQTTRA